MPFQLVFLSLKRFACIFVLLILIQCSAHAVVPQAATLTWLPSSDPNTVGYHVYYGTASHSYSTVVAAGNSTVVTIPGLSSGTTYYFAVTAYDDAGNESDFSNEATYPPSTSVTATLTTLTLSGGQFGFTVAGVPGQSYVIEASTNLTDWVPLETNTAPFTFVDPNAGNFQQRFFRSTYQGPAL